MTLFWLLLQMTLDDVYVNSDVYALALMFANILNKSAASPCSPDHNLPRHLHAGLRYVIRNMLTSADKRFSAQKARLM